jgi:hypothetical protein
MFRLARAAAPLQLGTDEVAPLGFDLYPAGRR